MFKPTQPGKDLHDLYCYETLSSFDDHVSEKIIIQAPHQINSSENGSSFSLMKRDTNETTENNKGKSSCMKIRRDYPKCRKKIDYGDYGSFDNCISMLDDNDYMKLLHPNEVLDKTHIENKIYRNGPSNFTSSLLKEFNQTLDHDKVQESNGVADELRNSENDKAHMSNTWSQTQSSCNQSEQLVPQLTATIDDVMDKSSQEQEIFVIKDEAPLDSDSGSEFEWNSLTPPVPGSPGDQRVPEIESGTCQHQNDFRHDHLIPSSSPELFSSLDPEDHFRSSLQLSQEFSHQNVHLLHSEADQVVPMLLL